MPLDCLCLVALMPKTIAKKKSTGKTEPLQVYVKRLVTQIGGKDSGVHMSSAALRGLSSMGRELMKRNALRSYELATVGGQKTIATKHARAAGKLHTFGTLARHAQSEGNKAAAKYKNAA